MKSLQPAPLLNFGVRQRSMGETRRLACVAVKRRMNGGNCQPNNLSGTVQSSFTSKREFTMPDLLPGLASHDVVVIVFFVLACLAGMTVWLTLQWRLHRRTEMEAALKQEMLNRGMSAEEIERVLRAHLSGS
jgi:hypothetical protein